MQYLKTSFTLPSSSPNVTHRQYDYSTLTKEEFIAKYGVDAEGYTAEDIATWEAIETAKEAAKAAEAHVHYHPTPPVRE